MGIYSLNKVSKAAARYSSTDLTQESLKLCEHVVFNSTLRQLFISTEWMITAPPEHIEFRLLSNFLKVRRIIQAGLTDIKDVVIDFLKNL